MTRSADVIVVGLGAAGSATLLALARRGVRVIGIDRFAPPHDQGSSHGETRVVREATGEGAEFVPLVQRSQLLWRELAAEVSEELFLRCGFLAVDASQGTAGRHGRPGFFETTVAIAQAKEIPFELPDPDSVRSRFPAFTLRGDEKLFFEPGAGLLYPERIIRAQLDVARTMGASVITDSAVTRVESSSRGVAVSTATGQFIADAVIVTAGPGLSDLVPAFRPRLRLLRQTLHWFAPTENWFHPELFPTFIWLHGPRPEDSFYGFPHIPSVTSGVKLSSEQFERETPTWDTLDRHVDGQESRNVWLMAQGRLRGLSDVAHRTASCVYTHTPDGRFLTEFVDEHDRVLAVSACSGHGFKHSAAVGENACRIVEAREIGTFHQ
jgi:sarcosine oxidase